MSSVTATLLTERPGGLHLTVRVKPRAAKSRVLGVRNGALEVAVAAPPVDGAANQELVKTIARFLTLKKSAIRLAGGATSRNKVLFLEGLALGEVANRVRLLEQGT